MRVRNTSSIEPCTNWKSLMESRSSSSKAIAVAESGTDVTSAPPLLVPVLPAGALLDREDYTSAFLLRPWRQEQPGLRVAGPQLQGSSLGQDPTVVDDQHVVGCLGLLHVVRREDDREPERFAQVPDRVPHLLTAARASKDSGPKTPTGRSAS